MGLMRARRRNSPPPRRTGIVILAAALLVVSATGAHAQSRYAAAGVHDERLVETFVADLQRAVARDDREAVAGMVQYPLTVLVGGLRLPVRSPADLLEYYDTIFTPELKASIARTTTGAAPGKGEPLGVSLDGLGIGGGALIVQPVGGALKVTSIRVVLGKPGEPPPAPPPAAGAPASKRHRSPAAGARKPTHLRAGTKQAPAQVSGTLLPGQTDAYVVWARENQLLDVRVHGVQGRAIVARVLDATSGKPLDARGHDGVRVWTGRVPRTGDYRVEVTRLDAGAGVLTYTLAVVAQ
jgi:hypothetical protein